MLGLLRFVLAMFVVVAHLTEGVSFFSHWGVFAVFGFYVISGYLITVILNETYSFRFFAFVANRFLRLFPIYYIVALGSLLIISFSSGASIFHSAWSIQTRMVDIIGNSLVFPFEFYDASFRVVPPTWSVAVELVCYFLLWLVVARNKTLAISIVLVSSLYHIVSLVEGADWTRRYSPFYAALLPFALGASIYFFRIALAALSSRASSHISLLSCVVWLINLVFCGFMAGLGGRFFDFFFYINLISLVVFVGTVKNASIKLLSMKLNKVLGDLAYPIFLTHWIVGYVVSQWILEGERRGLTLFAVSLFPILVVSYALSECATRLIEPLRSKVRNGVKSYHYPRVLMPSRSNTVVERDAPQAARPLP